jgi:hypothetical protein
MALQRSTRRVLVSMLIAAVCLPATARTAAGQAADSDDAVSAPPAQTSAPAPAGLFPTPPLIQRPLDLIARVYADQAGGRKSGLYAELSNMNSGAGWVSAGPGYRAYMLDDALLLDGSAALSWHLFKMVQARTELSLANERVTLGAQAMWQDQTQVDYFGRGPDSAEADRSQYRILTTDLVAYAAYRPVRWLTTTVEWGWLLRPSLEAAGGTFRPDVPDARNAFAGEPAAADPFQPNFLHGELGVVADTRDAKGHPSRGGVYRVTATTYRDQSTGRYSFDEYEAEGAQFVRVTDQRWVLALRGWLLVTDAGTGHQIPFYLQPSLGGSRTLRAYPTYRFHDFHAVVANVESRWAIFSYVDLAAFFDAGNVAARAADLNLAKTSYGAGVRVHTGRSTIAVVDVARGAEGWRVVVRTSDPLRLAHLTRRVARVPFAP